MDWAQCKNISMHGSVTPLFMFPTIEQITNIEIIMIIEYYRKQGPSIVGKILPSSLS
jgi:hypothetical protein